MSTVKNLSATLRDRVGKGAARELRRQNKVPAVIYGAGLPAISIALDYKTTHQLIFAGRFLTTIFEIDTGSEKIRALPRDFQLDRVRDFPIHVDFLRLSDGQLVKVYVPVHVSNQETAVGVKKGGTLQIIEHTVELLVPADSIPEFIEVSAAALDVGQVIHLSDVTLPEGAKPASKENATLVTIIAPKAA
jgi:large subunit ribosomal protein L25